MYVYNYLFVVLWDHTQQCLGIIAHSVLRDNSW